MVIFFASPAASFAYLTVIETFPIEIRAIAIFCAICTGLGGAAAPVVFDLLIQSGSRANVFWGYAFGAALMLAAAIVAGSWTARAERKPLEEGAAPLSAV